MNIRPALFVLLLAGCTDGGLIDTARKANPVTHISESRQGLKRVYVHSKIMEGRPSVFVSLLPFDSDPDVTGDVFIGSISDTTRRLTSADLQTEWLSDDSLMVRHSTELEVIKREQLVDGVHIVYDTKGR